MDTKVTNSDLIYMVTHQLRIPLTRNKWLLDYLINDTTDNYSVKQKGLFQKIYSDNERAIHLIDEILYADKEELSTANLDLIKTDLAELSQKIIDEIKSDAERKNIALTFTKSDNLSTVLVDPQKIRYVFENLFMNAIHYTPRGGSVSINMERVNTEIVVSVKDIGIGIPKDEQDKIFSKFFRASNAQKTENDGNGLGLFIIKRIIEEHNGKVWFESKENVGTTFWVSFPVANIS